MKGRSTEASEANNHSYRLFLYADLKKFDVKKFQDSGIKLFLTLGISCPGLGTEKPRLLPVVLEIDGLLAKTKLYWILKLVYVFVSCLQG